MSGYDDELGYSWDDGGQDMPIPFRNHPLCIRQPMPTAKPAGASTLLNPDAATNLQVDLAEFCSEFY